MRVRSVGNERRKEEGTAFPQHFFPSLRPRVLVMALEFPPSSLRAPSLIREFTAPDQI